MPAPISLEVCRLVCSASKEGIALTSPVLVSPVGQDPMPDGIVNANVSLIATAEIRNYNHLKVA